MFGIVKTFRSAILGFDWNVPYLAFSTAAALVFFLFRVFYFRRTDHLFADLAQDEIGSSGSISGAADSL